MKKELPRSFFLFFGNIYIWIKVQNTPFLQTLSNHICKEQKENHLVGMILDYQMKEWIIIYFILFAGLGNRWLSIDDLRGIQGMCLKKDFTTICQKERPHFDTTICQKLHLIRRWVFVSVQSSHFPLFFSLLGSLGNTILRYSFSIVCLRAPLPISVEVSCKLTAVNGLLLNYVIAAGLIQVHLFLYVKD